MISANTNSDTDRFMTYHETMIVKVLLKFFKRLANFAKIVAILITMEIKPMLLVV
jgi:hypothetical protein